MEIIKFLKNNYKKCWGYLLDTKTFILVTLTIFCLFILIGFTLPYFFTEEIMTFMKELLERFAGLNVYETITAIFFNNLKSSFMAMILGIGFGIVPIFVTITNGYLLGFVARLSVEHAGLSVLWRLVPHGIFELPAIIISTGIGLKLGVSIISKKRRKKMNKEIKESIRFFISVIFPLLVIAAIIEGILIFLF